MNKRVVIVIAALLAGCGGDNEDIKKWMVDASRDMRGRVEKIDEPKKFEPFKYDSDKSLDPFSNAKLAAAAEDLKAASKAGAGPRPDLSRRKDVLESFPLENLRMVGAIQQRGIYYAIIKADANLHRVKVGNYVGQNFGKITNITETEVKLQEMLEDGGGEYAYRDSTLVLQEEKK